MCIKDIVLLKFELKIFQVKQKYPGRTLNPPPPPKTVFTYDFLEMEFKTVYIQKDIILRCIVSLNVVRFQSCFDNEVKDKIYKNKQLYVF